MRTAFLLLLVLRGEQGIASLCIGHDANLGGTLLPDDLSMEDGAAGLLFLARSHERLQVLLARHVKLILTAVLDLRSQLIQVGGVLVAWSSTSTVGEVIDLCDSHLR